MPPQHLGETAFSEGQDLVNYQLRHRKYFAQIVKRKLGSTDLDPSEAKAPPKRRRVKSYVSLMLLNNQLQHSAGVDLITFIPEKDSDGRFVQDPFTWRGLSVCTDSGPDMVATCFFLIFKKGLNLQWDFDMSHWLNNTMKLSLKFPGQASSAPKRVRCFSETPCSGVYPSRMLSFAASLSWTPHPGIAWSRYFQGGVAPPA